MIDIYKICIQNKKNDFEYVISISENDLVTLNKIFLEYKNRTGFEINEYDDMKIKNENIDVLLDVFRNYMPNNQNTSVAEKYYNVLQDIKVAHCDVVFIGD